MTALQSPAVPETSPAPSAAPMPARRSWFVSALNTVPTIVTLGLLGSVAWFGHHWGWKLPKSTELRAATTASAEKGEEWCSSHNVPEKICVECNKEKTPYCKVPRWCKEHGVYECPTHHTELAQAATVKLPQYDTVAAINLMDRTENNSRCKKFLRLIQFESVEAFDKMGVDVDVVSERPMLESLRVNGELGYDQKQLAHLSTRSAGSVWKVFKQLGEEIKAGDVLALVDAAEVGKAKSELSRSIVHWQLRKKTYDSLKNSTGIVPERQVREAESALEEAQIAIVSAQQALVNMGFKLPDGLSGLDASRLTRTLQCLGIPNELCEELGQSRTMTMNLIPIIAPQDGIIVEMDVVAGEVVQPEKVLLTLADLDQMWLTLHVRQEDSALLSPNQKVLFKPDGSKKEIEGRITFISPAVDDQTRTLKVRAVLANEDRKLKANGFGSGQIILREEPKAVTVPIEALQSDGDCQIVFVRDKGFLKGNAPKVFYARQVRVGAANDTHVELLAGVLPGEVIATKGSASFRAELLKSSFGEGCCGGHSHSHGGQESKGGGHAGHEH